LLAALQKQTQKDFELIIAIDGSTDNTEEVVKKYEADFGNYKVVVQQNKGRAVIRNFGVQHASGELLIFYDDDMLPSTGSVSKHIEFHQTRGGLCTGSQRELAGQTKSDIHNYKAHLSAKWLSEYPAGLSQLSFVNLFFTAANCSLTRNNFQRLNGFDDRLTDAEDFDLAYRALELGIPVYFDKSNEAIHEENYTFQKLILRQQQYQKAHENLSILHPERSPGVNSGPSTLRKTFYWFFKPDFWLNIPNSHRLINVLPRQFRYKLYDWILYSHAVVFRVDLIKRNR
jgi:glycosyltransferase involved in cell wall biosynthesis